MPNNSTIGESFARRKLFWQPKRRPSHDWLRGGGEEDSIARVTSDKLTIIVGVDSTYDAQDDQSSSFYSSDYSKYVNVKVVFYQQGQSYRASEDSYIPAGIIGSGFPKEIQSDVWFTPYYSMSKFNVFEVAERRLNDVIEDISNDMVRQELYEFDQGIGGVRPEKWVVGMAVRISKVAIESTEQPDITVDIDGELSFYLRLKDGRLVLAELGVKGLLDASVYDGKDKLLKRMPLATEEELITVLRS